MTRAPDPPFGAYGVWVSEAMLQQTRVEAAAGHWLRFMDALPTVADLAAASEERVLALWSGLGYYRRARSLHAAARALVERHGVELPRTRAEWLALPGVGRYTAGAVLSIAFDLSEPLVDGNVARVFARWFGIDGELGRTDVQRELWALAEQLVPLRGAGDWNQALMELGATVCRPRDPDCAACPVQLSCAARRTGRERELPRMPARPEPVAVELVAVLARRAGDVLLERRPAQGRMAGLWQLPTAELPGPDGGRTGLFPPELPIGLRAGEPLGVLRHSITRHRIRCTVSRPAGGVEPRSAELAWVARSELAQLGLTGMARKALRARFALGR